MSTKLLEFFSLSITPLASVEIYETVCLADLLDLAISTSPRGS